MKKEHKDKFKRHFLEERETVTKCDMFFYLLFNKKRLSLLL